MVVAVNVGFVRGGRRRFEKVGSMKGGRGFGGDERNWSVGVSHADRRRQSGGVGAISIPITVTISVKIQNSRSLVQVVVVAFIATRF